MVKKFLCAFLCLFVFLWSGCEKKVQNPVYDVESDFFVTSMKTDSKECFLLRTANSNVLIDSAGYENAKEIVEFLKENGINTIDLFIITQFSDNSIGSASAILRKLNVKNIYCPSYIPKNTPLYKKYLSTLQHKGITPHLITTDETLTVDDAHFEFFGCDNSVFSNDENDCSLVFKITHGKNVFLFAGNIKQPRTEKLIEDKKNLDANFLKVPFWGKHTESTEKFIKNVSPEFAFINCSENNPADIKTEEMLKKKNTQIFYGYQNIHTFISDGKTIEKR